MSANRERDIGHVSSLRFGRRFLYGSNLGAPCQMSVSIGENIRTFLRTFVDCFLSGESTMSEVAVWENAETFAWAWSTMMF